eukprot:sb/3473039/
MILGNSVVIVSLQIVSVLKYGNDPALALFQSNILARLAVKPIFIFLGSFERSQCPLSKEPKILQIGLEMAELWAKTCKIFTDLVNIYRLPQSIKTDRDLSLSLPLIDQITQSTYAIACRFKVFSPSTYSTLYTYMYTCLWWEKWLTLEQLQVNSKNA